MTDVAPFRPAPYRKRPVTIMAVRFDGSTTHASAIQHWIATGDYINPGLRTADMRNLEIETLEGVMTAQPGDYIIRGVEGEFYPCKPGIFAQTYEAE